MVSFNGHDTWMSTYPIAPEWPSDNYGSLHTILRLRLEEQRMFLEQSGFANYVEEVESEEHFVCRCRARQRVRDRYPALFEGQQSLAHMMETRDMKRFGKLLLELHSSRENPLQTCVFRLASCTKGGNKPD